MHLQGDVGADLICVEAALRDSYGQSSVSAIMCGPDETLVGQRDEQLLKRALGLGGDSRGDAANETMSNLQVLAATKLDPVVTEEHNQIAGSLELSAHNAIGVLKQADDADHRRWIDSASVGLVIQADVAPSDRHAERATRITNPLDCLGELPHDRRPFGIAEIQTVGRPQGTRTRASNVACCLSHRKHRASIRIEVAVTAVSIDRQSQSAISTLNTNNAATKARQVHGIGPHHMVVLPVDPFFAADGWGTQQLQQSRIVVISAN